MYHFSINSNSPEQTGQIGQIFAKYLAAGDCIPFFGRMGSGKTNFIRGIAEGLNVSSHTPVRSPSFTIINRYKAVIPIYHVDLYRLDQDTDFSDLELEEIIHGNGITLIEWPDIIPDLLTRVPVHIYMTWDMKSETRRVISFRNAVDRFRPFFQELEHADFRN